jgi:glycosyltransferase involved in cell wall biosynthesis
MRREIPSGDSSNAALRGAGAASKGSADKKPLISILSSVYNERSYIEKAIDSVLKQTYTHWEWTIVDDGSTDGTGEILRGITDGRVHYTFQENTHDVARNFNKALKMSRGDLIATLDGDDYWPENKLELQVNSFDDQEVVLSYGECVLVNAQGTAIGLVTLPDDPDIANNTPTGSALRRLLTDVECFICNATVMYRKSSLSDIGGFVEAKGLFQDFSTWVLLSLSGKFAPIPARLGYYRKHLKSATFTVNQESYFENQVSFLREFYLNNFEMLRNIGLPGDLDTLEDHWHRIKRKNKMICWLISLSLFLKVDLANPLICLINRNPQIKQLLKRFLTY